MGEVWQRTAQAGLETTRFTPVAATRKVYKDVTFDEDIGIQAQDGNGRGHRFANNSFLRGNVSITGNWTDDLTYEDAAYAFLYGIRGGVTPTSPDTTAGSTVRRWTFTPNGSAFDVVSGTFEKHDGSFWWQVPGVHMPSWTVSGEQGAPAQFSADLAGQRKNREGTAGFTAHAGGSTGLANRNDLTIAHGYGVGFFIDDQAGTIGTTAVTNKLRSYSITYNQGIEMKPPFMDNVDGVSTRVSPGMIEVTGTFTLEWDTFAEYDKYRARSRRKIRLQHTHDTAISGSFFPYVRFDLYGIWEQISLGEAQSNITADYGFRGYVDPVENVPIRVEVQNNVASYT